MNLMKKTLLTLLLAAATITCVQAQTQYITVDNTQRNYLVYVPSNLGENRPLLISCHGMNQDAAYQKGMLAIEGVADTAKFVTVFPNGINKGWDISGDRDIKFMKALIDEMITKYKINPNQVFLSGFSMGGMFTYHAMNRMPDKIAAFAPISGYPMGGTTANASVRPIPIIHTHGTGDDVVAFSGVQGALNAWINHNNCPKTAKVTRNYRGASGITRHVWGPGNDGVEVVLMELADKGHWISNDWGVKTGDEIWKFCKRYSLEMKDPMVRISAPQDGLTYVTIGGESEVPDIAMKATASDPDGQVVKVAFYDGDELLQEFDKGPYNLWVKGLKKGEHQLRAVVTDDEGRTSSSSVTVYVEEPTANYVFTRSFTGVEGSVPEGWTTYDSEEKRTGYSSGYSRGSRVFHFTASQRDFEWGLYTRNTTGAAKAGYARYAEKATNTTLTLYPGNYQLMYKACNWNCPDFSPITVAVETIGGQEIFSSDYMPTANVGNTASNAFSGSKIQTVTFDVPEKDRYVVTFYTADAAWADLVLGQAAIKRKGDINAISDISTGSNDRPAGYYDLQGRRLNATPARGMYVKGGRKYLVK